MSAAALVFLFPAVAWSSPIPSPTPPIVSIDVRNLTSVSQKPSYDQAVLEPLHVAEMEQAVLEARKQAEAHQRYLKWLESIKERVKPYGTYTNNYASGNCTSFVASRVSVPDSMGNAKTWGYILGFSDNANVGAIAWTTAGWAGHVAVVEQVAGDEVLVSEENVYGLGVIDYRWTPINSWTGFIY